VPEVQRVSAQPVTRPDGEPARETTSHSRWASPAKPRSTPASRCSSGSAFTDATLSEIRAIHAKAGSSVVFQLELPVELVFVAKMPRPLRSAMAACLARGVHRLARRCPPGARFGVHLCLGDLGNKALGHLRDTGPLVALTNAIVRGWPLDRPLEYVHAPFAAGDEPAPADPAFYEPLSALRLPADVRFVAGFVHERSSSDEQRRILRVIEDQLGRRVDVATACGLGRRTVTAAAATMDRAAELVHEPRGLTDAPDRLA